MPTTDEDLARARLAYISAGRRPLSAPRRALASSTPDAVGPDPAKSDDGPQEAPGIPGAPWAQGLVRLDPALRRRYVAAVLVLLLIGVGITVVLLGRSEASQVPLEPGPVEVSVTQPAPRPSATPEPARIRVHVLGSVRWPGVVTLAEGAIVADALEAAGGLTPEADPAELNLAARLADGQQIIVGTATEPRGDLRDQPSSQGEVSEAGLVNLNTASAAALEELPGVGPVLAGAIITWREEHGGFRSVADLQEVPGIGPKTFATLEPLVTV